MGITYTIGQELNFVPVAPYVGAQAAAPFYYGVFVREQDGGVVVDGGRGERWVTADCAARPPLRRGSFCFALCAVRC